MIAKRFPWEDDLDLMESVIAKVLVDMFEGWGAIDAYRHPCGSGIVTLEGSFCEGRLAPVWYCPRCGVVQKYAPLFAQMDGVDHGIEGFGACA